MVIKNILVKKTLIINCILFGTIGFSNIVKADGDQKDAKKIAKEKGVLKPADVLIWETPQKSIPSDFIKINNTYFSAHYPKCFTITGENGESNPKVSPTVLFKRQNNCPNFSKDDNDSNLFDLGLSPTDFKSLDDAFTADYTILRQKIDLNGNDAVLLVGLIDSNIRNTHVSAPQLRWQIFTKCKKNTLQIIASAPTGKETLDRVDKNNYEFPEDFKKIVSTFKCK